MFLFLASNLLALAPPGGGSSLAPLFTHIWRITSATPFLGSQSIYIFLRNGTLLEASCVETYRVATWKADTNIPGAILVTEDGRPAFTAIVSGFTGQTLHLRQTLAFGDRAVREVDLEAIDKEFVCPDLPK